MSRNKNLVSSRNCAQPLGDHQHRVVVLKALDRLLHQQLALGIHGNGGLIEIQQLWIALDYLRQAQALPLAATEPVARSTTTVSYPFGRLSMKPATCPAQ